MLQRLLFAFLFIPFFSFGQYEGPRPNWVKLVEAPAPDSSWLDDGQQFLAYDHQVDLANAQTFYRYAYLLESPDAVSTYSNISISYEPSFRSLTFHNIFVIRDGERIDLLANHEADLIRTESSRSRLIYDSSMSMVYNLRDIRPGDILQYEFSLKGRNPAFKDHYYTSEPLQRYIPLGYFNYRVIVPKSDYPEFSYDGPVVEPIEKKGLLTDEYIWELNDLEAATYQSGEPSSYDPRPRVAISNYHNWGELMLDALQLYQTPLYNKAALKEAALEIVGSEEDKEKQLLALSRFVQDEIRYLGFENGIHAYKPHNPLDVLHQRYGDCKDKSMLLVELMRSLNVEAYPMWVSSYRGKRLLHGEVSPYVFNHCVMLAIYEGDSIYIDPTQSDLGGSFKELNFPMYGKGLIIKDGVKSLNYLPKTEWGRVSINDKYVVKSKNGEPSFFQVTTVFEGDEADNMRDYLSSNTPESISDDYTNYYQSYWPSLKAERFPSIKDDRAKNIIYVNEYYAIDSIWEASGGRQVTATFYAPALNDFLTYYEDADRSAPQSLTFPKILHYEVDIELPEDWPLEEEVLNVSNDEYRYSYRTTVNASKTEINIVHDYETLKPEVAPEDFSRMVRDHDKMLENVGYIVHKIDDQGLAGAKANSADTLMRFLVYIVRFLSLLLTVVLIIFLHKRYDPLPAVGSLSGPPLSIGGWMVLPLIGLFLSPFVMAYSIVDAWDDEMISTLASFLDRSNSFANPTYVLLVLVEHFVDISMVILPIFLIVQFFQQRTSLPRIIIFYLIFRFVWAALLSTIMVQMELADPQEVYGDVFRLLVAAALWGPYFASSQRVKDTFTKTYQPLPSKLAAGPQENADPSIKE